MKDGKSTMRSIASRLGVSASTISRALNPKTAHLISEPQRKKITDFLKNSDYYPNLAAKALTSNRNYTVGLPLHALESDLASPFLAPLLASTIRHLKDKDYSLAILPVLRLDSLVEEMTAYFRTRRVDGFLISSALIEKGVLDYLREKRIPTVLFDHLEKPELDNGFCVVRIDEGKAAGELADALWTRGHRDIAYLLPESKSLAPRFQAFKKAWSLRSGKKGSLDAVGYEMASSGYLAYRDEACRETLRQFDRLSSRSAIVCSSDFVAMGVMDALKGKGVKTGSGGISVIGYDNMEENQICKSQTPSLCTIKIDYGKCGELLSGLLMDAIDNPGMTQAVKRIPTELVVRKSLANAVMED